MDSFLFIRIRITMVLVKIAKRFVNPQSVLVSRSHSNQAWASNLQPFLRCNFSWIAKIGQKIVMNLLIARQQKHKENPADQTGQLNYLIKYTHSRLDWLCGSSRTTSPLFVCIILVFRYASKCKHVRMLPVFTVLFIFEFLSTESHISHITSYKELGIITQRNTSVTSNEWR